MTQPSPAGEAGALLAVGAPAPDFEAAASDGRRYRLSEVLRDAAVVLYFYPGNDTPG